MQCNVMHKLVYVLYVYMGWGIKRRNALIARVFFLSGWNDPLSTYLIYLREVSSGRPSLLRQDMKADNVLLYSKG